MNSLSNQLKKMIPKSLDDIIRLQRDTFRLEMASSLDLDLVAGEVPHTWLTRELGTAYFYKRISSIGPTQKEVLTLVAYDRNGHPYHTSRIVHFDRSRMRVLTSSQSIYSISNISNEEPPEQLLMMICAMFWKDGIGEVLGVPHFFY